MSRSLAIPIPSMTDDQRRYLMRLVRMDIRKQRKNLSRMGKRPEQTWEEFHEVFLRFGGNLRFAEEAYRTLGGDPDNITNVTDG